ncbi:Uncharacterised protein [Mycobacteroides abscessus subsp. abscessus]|nr:Uncharacterised protein [Mycobacteroides abscessus subsp. abscessus]
MPTFSASWTLIHTCWPPRESCCMNQLSWYWEWMAHLKCGVRYLTETPNSLVCPSGVSSKSWLMFSGPR